MGFGFGMRFLPIFGNGIIVSGRGGQNQVHIGFGSTQLGFGLIMLRKNSYELNPNY